MMLQGFVISVSNKMRQSVKENWFFSFNLFVFIKKYPVEFSFAQVRITNFYYHYILQLPKFTCNFEDKFCTSISKIAYLVQTTK